MRLQPHENLTVWSLRHDLYGPGRFHHTRLSLSHPQLPCRPAPCAGTPRPDITRVVESPWHSQPADCRRSEWRGVDHPQSPPFYLRLPLPPTPRIITVPAAIAPAEAAGALHGYVYGQAIPTAGNLLDVVA